MKEVLTLKSFTYLYLAKMAEKTQIIQLKPENKNIVVCSIPGNYKQTIQNIICEQNGWTKQFSNLIDVEEYFSDHFKWEKNFARSIKEVLKELNKDYTYDFVSDTIRLNFTEKEIETILSKYPTYIVENMDHFTNLAHDFIYSRQYQEQCKDNSSRSIKLMHDLNEKYYHDRSSYNKYIEEISKEAYGDKPQKTNEKKEITK